MSRVSCGSGNTAYHYIFVTATVTAASTPAIRANTQTLPPAAPAATATSTTFATVIVGITTAATGTTTGTTNTTVVCYTTSDENIFLPLLQLIQIMM